MAKRKSKWFEVGVDLRNHPKLISTAKSLGLPKVYIEGHLVNMWSAAADYAEDGDLWRGDEESSLRFFESLTEIPSEPERYLEVFRKDRWIDGWLIHDWLDYQSRMLIARHGSHNRAWLVETYAKYGREYGREAGSTIISPQGRLFGSDWQVIGNGREVNGENREVIGNDREVNGNNSDPPITLNLNQYPNPTTLNPYAQDQTNEKSPMGGVEGIVETTAKTGIFTVNFEGSRAPGCAYTQAELTGNALPHKEIFETFMKLLVMHSILTLESFYQRVKHCNVSPATWMMLFLDKIHAVYRDRHGTTLLDDDADPVAMTMAGFRPNKSRCRHCHTEAARMLFIEIMMDHTRGQEEGKSKWIGRLSGPAIALELDRRKGKAGKLVC